MKKSLPLLIIPFMLACSTTQPIEEPAFTPVHAKQLAKALTVLFYNDLTPDEQETLKNVSYRMLATPTNIQELDVPSLVQLGLTEEEAVRAVSLLIISDTFILTIKGQSLEELIPGHYFLPFSYCVSIGEGVMEGIRTYEEIP